LLSYLLSVSAPV